MEDSMSTKSSESSITTSGEYEIVSPTSSPIQEQQQETQPLTAHGSICPMVSPSLSPSNQKLRSVPAPPTIIPTTLSQPADNGGNKSPTLEIINKGNISELQHEMTDALRDLQMPDEKSSIGDGKENKPYQKDSSKAMTLPLKNSSVRECGDGTSSPVLIVPSSSSLSLGIMDKGSSSKKSMTLNEPMKNISILTPVMGTTPVSTVSNTPPSLSEHNRVGHSIFYDCLDASPAAVVGGGSGTCIAEPSEVSKSEKADTDEELSEIDQGCTIFSGVTYLGASSINAPRSETDVYRIMSELNSGTTNDALKISISIPNCADGLVVLHDAETSAVFATFEIRSIILYFRGPVETVENGCFAFTRLYEETMYQCHVFRCHIPEAVNQVSACFQKAFQTNPMASMTSSLASIGLDCSSPICAAGYEFIVSLEIRERVAKNQFSPVPRDRNCFKLRAHTDKEVHICLKQSPSPSLPPLLIERCFGVLLSAGKQVRQADMQLIDMISMGYQPSTAAASQQQQHQQQQQQQQQLQTNGVNGTTGAIGGLSSTAGSDAMSSSMTAVQQQQQMQPLCLSSYYIHAEWKANEKAFEQLNVEATRTFLTIAVHVVMRGIKEPVRFEIETAVSIQSPNEMRIMEHFMSKRPMTMRFYLQLKRTSDEFSWAVKSIDPSEDVTEAGSGGGGALLKFGINNLARMVRSSSIVSIEDDCPTDYSSDGDEPLLSGTGEVSKECPQDTLDEWGPVLKEWTDIEKRPRNLAPLVRLGVPEALREKVWQKLANVEGKTEMLDMYKTLITKETKCETVIQRDIHRTFPAHKLFKETGGSGQDALFKVSKAYAVYDSEVGYCQGLSFIAASLLLHMPEEDAFCVLVALMYDYGLRDLYKQGFDALYLRFYQLDRLLQCQLPRLYEHFLACGIETHMYASQWFLTLFTARFPLCFVFHVLDVFLLDGLPLLFQVALTLLSVYESDLRQLDFEGILKYFRVTLPKKCRSAAQARRIVRMACDRKIKKLKQYEEEYMLKRQHRERLEKEAQIYETRFGEERRKLQTELLELQQRLAELQQRGMERERTQQGIIGEYKVINKRLEQDIMTLNETLADTKNIMKHCDHCKPQLDSVAGGCKEMVTTKSSSNMSHSSSDVHMPTINNGSRPTPIGESTDKNQNTSVVASFGPLDPLHVAMHRIRELELELAQAKLAQVEAECRNQDLNHQLNNTISELQMNRNNSTTTSSPGSNSWQPWLSKTFNTLQERVTTRSRDNPPVATFQSYMSGTGSAGGSETNSPCANQEFKGFTLSSGSPKLGTKFQTTRRLRNSIDNLRNIVDISSLPQQLQAMHSTTATLPRTNRIQSSMESTTAVNSMMATVMRNESSNHHQQATKQQSANI